ncbi:MAG TPA: RNA methyltransferase [Gaiellaceae bacterium]|nr:RNA methyltransferase [Gaiellaceae bacterium]
MITSTDNPRVKDVVRLRKGRERRRDGLFIAEGVREVERALAAGLTARAIYVDPTRLTDWALGGEEVSDRVLAKMAYRTEPEGVLAVFETPTRTIPPDATLVLVAVGIEKPGNLGAMARTADAAGVDALLVADAESDPWNPNAIRASTGAVFTLPIVETTLDDVAQLPQQKIAAALGASARHTDPDYTQPTAFLIGAEHDGLDDRWRAIADMHVEIPMQGTAADSLNASAAAAVLLFEAVRQRG